MTANWLSRVAILVLYMLMSCSFGIVKGLTERSPLGSDININNIINVTWLQQGSSSCQLTFQGKHFKCSLGKNGVAYNGTKVEGDGKTPSGSFPLRQIYYRNDKGILPPSSPLPVFATKPRDCWCDDINITEFYNRYVECPVTYSHELLWMTDSQVYDLLAVIGYNDSPPEVGKGSAIFFHVTESYAATAGCVAMALMDLEWVLNHIDESTVMMIH